ncbi:MAG TPA: response regulator [Longimicrobiaceae bacterium]|nr:response regulator [Longimicrobiaceae bacterium]
MNERRPKILLVEDNETIRNAFGILLEEHGYRVDAAASGGEALEKAASDLPDLILMDLGLPDANGLDVTRRLKADPRTRDALVVALTGRALETDQAACLEAGCAGYLAKPINTAELLRRIPEFLGAAPSA